MPFRIPVPNCVLNEQVLYYGDFGFENTVWFRRLTGAPNLFNVTALNTALATWYKTNILPLLAGEVQWVQAVTTDMSHISGVSANNSAFPQNGSNTSGIMPTNVGFRINFYSDTPGRATTGGNVAIGIPRDQVIGNFISIDFADQLRSAYVLLFDLATVEGWEWVVVSLRAGGVYRAEGLVSPVENVDYSDLRIDSSRYRLQPADI